MRLWPLRRRRGAVDAQQRESCKTSDDEHYPHVTSAAVFNSKYQSLMGEERARRCWHSNLPDVTRGALLLVPFMRGETTMSEAVGTLDTELDIFHT